MNAGRGYVAPPDGYRPPTRCEQCDGVIIFGPVIGGHIWRHVIRADHDAVMRPAGWWDTALGITRYGNGRDALVDPPRATGVALDV